MNQTTSPLLSVDHFSFSFYMDHQRRNAPPLEVISDFSLSLHAGEILAVAGSSGSGKSLLAQGILGLIPENATVKGELLYKGSPLTPARQCALRGRDIALIPQSVTALDPLMRVRDQVLPRKTSGSISRQQELFRRLGLAPETETLYPFQLSGGMARRVLFSTAVLSDAQLVIADEPTPGMHPAQAAEALSILRDLADAGKGILLITHDLDLALNIADRIAVFYAGTTVEETAAADFTVGPDALRHPYSKALWQALPQNGFLPIPGSQPYPGALPKGCLFAPRCPIKTSVCRKHPPPVKTLRGGKVRCFHAA